MTLRNLNRKLPRGRICGTPKTGVLGSIIPSTGENGPGYIYNSLNLPDDASKEYQGYIKSLPTGLELFAYEDSSFIASAPDGVYVVPWELFQNGIFLGEATFTLTFGAGSTPVVISCSKGEASAAGKVADIIMNTVVKCTVGSASADGKLANIVNNTVISCSVAIGTATGRPATIVSGGNTNIKPGDRLSISLLPSPTTITLM